MDDPKEATRDFVLASIEQIAEQIYDIADDCGLDPMFIVWLMAEQLVKSAVNRYDYDPRQVVHTLKHSIEREEMKDVKPRVLH